MILEKNPFLTLFFANPQLSLPPGCLYASLSELQETGEFTCTTLVPGNWVASSLRCFTCRVGLVCCNPSLLVRGGTPLPVLTLRVCCCPSLVQLGGELNQRSDRIKPIPTQKRWHGGEQSCLQQWYQPASVAGETSVVLCPFSRSRSGFGWSISFASVTGLELWQEHPHGSSVPRFTGEVRS